MANLNLSKIDLSKTENLLQVLQDLQTQLAESQKANRRLEKELEVLRTPTTTSTIPIPPPAPTSNLHSKTQQFKGDKFTGEKGSVEIKEFLSKVELQCMIDNTPISQKILVLLSGLSGRAHQDIQIFKADKPSATYQEVTAHLTTSFTDKSKSEKAYRRLHTIKQTGKVKEFNKIFSQLVLDLDQKLPDPLLISAYTTAVKEELALQLWNKSPTTLASAMNITEGLEDLLLSHQTSTPIRSTTTTTTTSSTPSSSNNNNSNNRNNNNNSTPYRTPTRQLHFSNMPAWMEELPKKQQQWYEDGKCVWCGTKYSRAHGKTCDKRKLSVNETVVNEEINPDSEYIASNISKITYSLEGKSVERLAHPKGPNQILPNSSLRSRKTTQASELVPGSINRYPQDREKKAKSVGTSPASSSTARVGGVQMTPRSGLKSKRSDTTLTQGRPSEIEGALPAHNGHRSERKSIHPPKGEVLPALNDQQPERKSMLPSASIPEQTILPQSEWIMPKIERSLLIDLTIAGKTITALLDSGSEGDLISDRVVNRFKFPLKKEPITLNLGGASGQIFDRLTHSSTLPTQLGELEAEQWPYWVAKIRHDVVLGIPWLRAHRVEIDWTSMHIKIAGTPIPLKVQEASKIVEVSAMEYVSDLKEEGSTGFLVWVSEMSAELDPENQIPTDLKELLNEFKDRFPDPLPGVKFVNLPPDAAPSRGDFDHSIPLTDESSKAYFQHPRPLSQSELEVLKERIKDLLRLKHIQRSKGPWGAPVLFVRKKDGTLRLCIDYRRLNKLTIKDVYPLPLIASMIDKLKQAQYFTKIDLDGAYHQVRVKESDIPKTGFNCELGHFEFKVMTFGFTNAPATFQRLMNEIFETSEHTFVVVYLDDILIFSNTWEEHLEHVRWALQKLRENSLFAKAKKCEWGKQEIEYLGHVIRPGQVLMDPKKIQAVVEWPVPTSVKEVQSFLGLANYYRRFIYQYSQIATPLTNLIKKGLKWAWTEETQQAFTLLKEKLTSAPVLQIFDPNRETRTEHDASKYAWAAILSQKGDDSHWHPVCFESKKYTPGQKNYDTPNQEFLSIVEALKKWRHYLYGKKFGIITDHQSLTFIPSQPNLTPRQARQVEFMSQFDYEILYRSGPQNIVADALSRRIDHLATNITPSSDFFKSWESLYSQDSELKLPYALVQQHPDKALEFSILNGLLRRKGKLCVPQGIARAAILQEHHNSPSAGHPGMSKTLKAIKENYWWPSMCTEIEEYVRQCHTCQVNKAKKTKPQGLLQPLPIPQRNWVHVACDFLTGLPNTVRKHDTAYIVVDRKSKMARFIPTYKTADAEKTAQLFCEEIYRPFGMPASITSDRDPKFTSHFWEELFTKLGTQLAMSTVRHPETDGQSEKTIQILQQYLRIFCKYNQKDWDQLLWIAEFAYNSAYQDSTQYSPFQVVLGYQPFTPLTLTLYQEGQAGVPAVDKFLSTATNTLNECRKTLDTLGLHTDDEVSFNIPTPLDKQVSFNIKLAQEKQAHYSNQKRREVTLKVGDQILIKTSDVPLPQYTSRDTKSLSQKYIGPYTITKQLNETSFQVRLPGHLSVTRSFHSSQLAPYHQPTKPVQAFTGFIPYLEDTPIQQILDRRAIRGATQYLALYSNGDQHWIPSPNLEQAHQLIIQWEDSINNPKAVTQYRKKLLKHQAAS